MKRANNRGDFSVALQNFIKIKEPCFIYGCSLAICNNYAAFWDYSFRQKKVHKTINFITESCIVFYGLYGINYDALRIVYLHLHSWYVNYFINVILLPSLCRK